MNESIIIVMNLIYRCSANYNKHLVEVIYDEKVTIFLISITDGDGLRGFFRCCICSVGYADGNNYRPIKW